MSQSQNVPEFLKPNEPLVTAPDSGEPTYIPQKPQQIAGIESGLATQKNLQRKRIEDATKGRASNIADPMLAMQGIVNGDPVGMETFDLGFFDDGTPAVSIGGHPIPVDESMWMSVMNMRVKTRDAVEQQIQFDMERQKAETLVTKMIAAMPNLPPDLAQALSAFAQIDPQFAMQEAHRLAVNMAYDGGRTQTWQVQAELQDLMGSQYAARYFAPRKKLLSMEERARLGTTQDEIQIPSVRDEAFNEALQNGDMEMATALRMSEWFTGGGEKRRLRGRRGLPTAGLFDLTQEMDGNAVGNPNAMLLKAMLIASNKTLNGSDYVPIPNYAQTQSDVVNYVDKLQQWANRNWGFGPSDPLSSQTALQYIAKFLHDRTANSSTQTPSGAVPPVAPIPQENKVRQTQANPAAARPSETPIGSGVPLD